MNEQETERERLRPILNRLDSDYLFMVDVGEGWYDLVLELDRQIAEIAPDYIVTQVKEKFGGLRYYIGAPGPRHEEIYRLITEAEIKSFKMCETCGQPGVLRAGGWMKTLCDEHSNGRPAAHFDPGV